MEHKVIPAGQRHPAHDWEFANAEMRLAAVVTVAQVGRLAIQTDNNTLWWLRSHNPIVWSQLASQQQVSSFQIAALISRIVGTGITAFPNPAVSLATVKDYLPSAFKQKDLDFSTTIGVAGLSCAFAAQVGGASLIEAEGSGWVTVGEWGTGSPDSANRNTGSRFSQAGPSGPISRTETFRIIKVFAQQHPTLSTLVLALTRNGVTTTYPFLQNSTANSGAPNGNTPQISVDLGSIGSTLIQFYSAINGSFCAFDAIELSTGTISYGVPSPISTPVVAGKLQLAPAGAGYLVAVTTARPKGGWWTVEADIASAVNPVSFEFANVFVGIYKDQNNFIGGLFIGKTGSFQNIVRLNGVTTLGPVIAGAISLPGSIKVVCTGTGLVSLYRSGDSGPWVHLDRWLGGDALLQNSIYDSQTYSYAVMCMASAGGWDVKLNSLRAGYFGATCLGDNSLVLNDDGSPVVVNNKLLIAGSARDFGVSGDVFRDFIRNNMCAVISMDLSTGVYEFHALVFHRWSNEIQGEGSPCFVRDLSTTGFHSFTPAWHFSTNAGVTQVRNAYGYSPIDITVAGTVVIVDASVRHYDALKPNEVAYDVAWTKLSNGTWRGCTTVQYVNGEQGQGFQMYGKIVQSTDLSVDVHTVIKTDTTAGFPDAYEGWRLLKFNGNRYFVGAGYTNLRVLDMDGNFVINLSQPAVLQGQTYPSHFAARQITVGDDPYRIQYIGFDCQVFEPGHNITYGRTHVFLSINLQGLMPD